MDKQTEDSSLIILGRQSTLSLAELESLYGLNKVIPFGQHTALVELPSSKINFNNLGGSIKLGTVIEKLDTDNWGNIEHTLKTLIMKLANNIPSGKIQLGLSVYDFNSISPQRVSATGLSLKKVLKNNGRSVRLVPNIELALSSAQVHHNHLADPGNIELLITKNQNEVVIAKTANVQDIKSYTMRDRFRPKRDTRVGMLPPKLAQIIINLATGQIDRTPTILDPFCGTGVILQEAHLMGYKSVGTDLDDLMVDYSIKNLQWLLRKDDISPVHIETADATNFKWYPADLDIIASEVYLGKPFTSRPSLEVLGSTISECNLIIKKFLQNIHSQLPLGARLCLAVPAWQVSPDRFKHLPLIDQLDNLGYNHISFKHTRSEDLIYYREDQFVTRELLVLTRK